MSALIGTPIFAITITLAAYMAAVELYRRSGQIPLLHPILIASIVLAVILRFYGISFERYHNATHWLNFLLGPATVALAIPLYQNLRHIVLYLIPIALLVVLGGISAPLISASLAKLVGASPDVLLSTMAKSVTTPIAMQISSKLGGIVTLTAGIVIATGIVGGVVAPYLFRWFNIRDDRLQGLCLGILAHGVGTAKAFEISSRCGAFASLGMGLTGICTAFLLPIVFNFSHTLFGFIPN